jgi:hypothetical protein
MLVESVAGMLSRSNNHDISKNREFFDRVFFSTQAIRNAWDGQEELSNGLSLRNVDACTQKLHAGKWTSKSKGLPVLENLHPTNSTPPLSGSQAHTLFPSPCDRKHQESGGRQRKARKEA